VQVSHIYVAVAVSTGSISCYWPEGGDAWRLGR